MMSLFIVLFVLVFESASGKERQNDLTFRPYRAKYQSSCSISAFSNTSDGAEFAQWNKNVIVISQVTIPKGQFITGLAAYFLKNEVRPEVVIEILIYNSTSNGLPGTLSAKIPKVNTGSISGGLVCFPLPNSVATSYNGVYWIGFHSVDGYSTTVISRSTTKKGINYYYAYSEQISITTIGNSFPSNGTPASSPVQLNMGVTTSSCDPLDCNSCIGSSSCVWCLASKLCISNSEKPQCGSWTKNTKACPACGYNNCGTCAGSQKCAWCEIDEKVSGCVLRENEGNCTTFVTDPQYCF